MSGWDAVDRFLQTDPRDVGCEQTMAVLHIYVELVLSDTLGEAQRRYPGVTAHLLACGPCGEDYQGLLLAVGGLQQRDRPARQQPDRAVSPRSPRCWRRTEGRCADVADA